MGIRDFFACKKANMSAISAIGMLPVMAGVAGAVDYFGVSNKASEIQNALDATAIAVATRYHSGMTEAELTAFAEDFFRSNLRLDERVQATFSYSSASSPGDNSNPPSSTVEVTSSLVFQGMVGLSGSWRTRRDAKAIIVQGQPACVLALDETASGALNMQGSTEVVLDGCVLAANSRASDAILRGGAAQVSAKCVYTSGGTSGFTNNSNADLECPAPLERRYPTQDPLAHVEPPSYTACQNFPNSRTKTLSPGTYCNKKISGEVTLKPGTYILRGGEIRLGRNGSLTGIGVTIFLMEGAQIIFGANEVITLSPPDEEPYAGITIYQERDNTEQLTLNGGVGSSITGFIYAPGAHIDFAGNSSMTGGGDCIRIIGKTIQMTGNSSVSSDCEAVLGGIDFYAGQLIKLVQ